MSTSSFRGWVMGLALAAGSGAGSYLAVSHGQQSQAAWMQQMVDEISLLRKAVQSRPQVPSTERVVTVGMPPSMKSGEVKLSAEELDGLAARMIVQLKQSGALGTSSREPHQPPPPPPRLEPAQQEALGRANGLVDRVLATGRMTPEDIQGIRRELASVKGRTEAEEVRRRLIVAINRNQVVPPDGPEPLP